MFRVFFFSLFALASSTPLLADESGDRVFEVESYRHRVEGYQTRSDRARVRLPPAAGVGGGMRLAGL